MSRKFWIAAPLIFALVAGSASGCKSISKGEREPASAVCDLTANDENRARQILGDPELYERKIQARLNALVEAYLLGEELVAEFDELLAKGFSEEELYESDTYARLQALKEVKGDLRETLEDIQIVRINDSLRGASGRSRSSRVQEALNEIESRLIQIVRSGDEQSRFAQLALMEISEDVQDLREYYMTCNPESMGRDMEGRAKRRQSAFLDLKGVRALRGAYRAWSPKVEDKLGINVAKIVIREASRKMKEFRATRAAARGAKRQPQSELIRPDVGPAGNITGSKFPAGVWALTFDDGPGATTPQVVENLDRHGLKATFFNLTRQMQNKNFTRIALDQHARGHSVVSHSYTHAQIPKLGPEGKRREIIGAIDEFEKILGFRPGFFRLPYGSGVGVASVRQLIKEGGMVHVFWNVDTLDWQDKNPESIYQRTLKQMQQLGRGIILFHDIHPQSVVASEMVMKYLADPANQLEAVTIPQIVDRMNGAAPAL